MFSAEVTFVFHPVTEIAPPYEWSDHNAKIFHFYVLEPSGEIYVAADPTEGIANLAEEMQMSYNGIISNPIEATEDGYYTVMTAGESSITYGIPDEANNKTIFEHSTADGWVECGGSDIIDVTELPSQYEDVNVYVRLNASTYMTFLQLFQSNGVNPDITYYVVDELPTTGTVTDFNTLASVYVYIANNIPYAYGKTGYGNMWIPVSSLMAEIADISLPDKGFTSNITAETNAGIYVTYKENEKFVEGAVYRVTGEASAEVYVVGQGGVSTAADAFGGGVSEVYVVETLPETLTPSANGMFYFYVVESTGFAYLDAGSGTLSFGTVLNSLDKNATDRGWTDDVTSETKYGSYCVRLAPTCTLYTYSDGKWTEYVDRSMADKECANAVEDATAPFVDYFATAFSVTVLEIPEGVGEIAHAIIDGTEWGNLKTIKFPASLTALNGNIVKNCENLAKVIFKGTPTKFIGSAAFVNCPKITDIYVPWASGAVGGAPWGAPNTATIHYNSDTANM
jgi:hypothetical protein